MAGDVGFSFGVDCFHEGVNVLAHEDGDVGLPDLVGDEVHLVIHHQAARALREVEHRAYMHRNEVLASLLTRLHFIKVNEALRDDLEPVGVGLHAQKPVAVDLVVLGPLFFLFVFDVEFILFNDEVERVKFKFLVALNDQRVVGVELGASQVVIRQDLPLHLEDAGYVYRKQLALSERYDCFFLRTAEESTNRKVLFLLWLVQETCGRGSSLHLPSFVVENEADHDVLGVEEYADEQVVLALGGEEVKCL